MDAPITTNFYFRKILKIHENKIVNPLTLNCKSANIKLWLYRRVNARELSIEQQSKVQIDQIGCQVQ